MREAFSLHWRQRQGFSLLEVIIGAGIIGILGSIMVLYIRPESSLDAAENAKRRVYIEQQEGASLEFSVKENAEPAEDIPMGKENAEPVCRTGTQSDTCIDFSALNPQYLLSMPIDAAEENTDLTGYYAYKNDSWEIKFCNAYLPTTYAQYCAGDGSGGGETSSIASSQSSSAIATCTNTPFQAGDGTVGNPYQICNCSQLQNISALNHYIVTADIDCSATAGWNGGAGFAPRSFNGTFDGNNHIISNLHINRPSTPFVGLFELVSGTIQNIHLRNIEYITSTRAGGLAASLMGGTIRNSSVTGTITSANGGYLGGMVGLALQNGTLIEKSWADVDITATSPGGIGVGAGGLVGSMNSQAIVRNCYAHGDVQITNESAGGLVGYIEGGATIVHSYATGLVSTTTHYVSGLAAGNGGLPGAITNSYYDSQTTGQSDTTNGSIPKTTEQMKQQATFSGWDFNTIWQITEAVSYPTLR